MMRWGLVSFPDRGTRLSGLGTRLILINEPVCVVCVAMDIQKASERREEEEEEENTSGIVAGVFSRGNGKDKEQVPLLPPRPGETQVVVTRQGSGKLFLGVLTFFSALGGFLFGYDTGVVSGAMVEVKKHFSLDSTWVEILVSTTIAAAAVTAALGGPLCELLGRKIVLLSASVVFTVGAIVIAASPQAWVFLIGRIIVGGGIGLAAMAVPMYIAELAPTAVRGRLVVLNNLFITGGQFIAAVIDGAFSYLRVDLGWRFMFGLASVPSFVMFVGFLFMPESPRWLVFHNRTEKARTILGKVRPLEDVEEELQSIVNDYEDHRKSHIGFKALITRFCTSRPVMIALVVGCGLQLFQQFGGINTVMYYSASIIQMAGFSDEDSIWLATIPAFGNFIFTLVGLALVEHIGRRKLLLASTAGFIFAFLLLSATFVTMDHYSPAAQSVYSHHRVNNTCQYSSCGACVGNSKCGFCVDYDPTTKLFLNGTCELGDDGVNSSFSYFQPTYYYDDINVTMVCGLYYENFNANGRIEGEPQFNSLYGNDTLLPMNDSIQRLWNFRSCPNNRLAPLAIVALFIYIAFFAPGMGPLPWTINSEIYPTWARSMAIAIATSVNWICNLIVSMTFLTLADNLGQPSTFGLYAGLGLLGFVFFLLFVPETKGKSLEDVEELFQVPHFVTWCFTPKGKSDCAIL